MNKDLFHGRWKQISGMVKQTWGNLSEQELMEVDGRIDRLEGLLQEKYGYARDEVKRRLNRLLKDLDA